jgi:hypothetical protein
MTPELTDAELKGYLDEALGADRMSVVEKSLRDSPQLRSRAAALQRSRHQGHAVSEIWQRGRLSCPSREQLASHLRGALDPAWRDYIEFHIQVAACRYCLANLADLEQSAVAEITQRRQKVFQSSAGKLRRE